MISVYFSGLWCSLANAVGAAATYERTAINFLSTFRRNSKPDGPK
jgi:hypothetical protein